MNDAVFDVKNILDITGVFEIPSYQRGYRWGEEATQLLDDLMEMDFNGSNHYCLQPIVVKKIEEGRFALIDGQQRLTTLFLILKVLKKKIDLITINFSINYTIRTRCTDFLNNISEETERMDENIDFHYIKTAYDSISDWFDIHIKKVTDFYELYKLLENRVDVIWYEVDSDEKESELFRNLNSGKIPLTNSELVKAMFLSETIGYSLSQDNKKQIAYQWDTIEKELSEDSFWYFLTKDDYRPRIDLVLYLNSGCSKDSKDKYVTFHHYDKIRKEGKNLQEIWDDIQHTFLILKDWYKNHELYHLVGFLTKEGVSLNDIYQLSLDKTKREFIAALKEKIKELMKLPNNKNYGDLSYENKGDWKRIQRLLLLFNVISTKNHGEESEWFSFDKYEKGKWSLEHIHAQQSQGIVQKVEVWKEWLKLHLPSVKTIDPNNSVITDIERYLAPDVPISNDIFEALRLRVEAVLSEDPNVGCKHTISNMALLSKDDNSALNNSTFDVKRNKIIELDQAGQFIPYCTKMVFLKYYSSSETTQLHFWGAEDRKSYIKNMNEVLKDYLEEPILEDEEDGVVVGA